MTLNTLKSAFLVTALLVLGTATKANAQRA